MSGADQSDLQVTIHRWQVRRHKLRVELLRGPDEDPPMSPEREANLRFDIAECDRFLGALIEAHYGEPEESLHRPLDNA